MSNQAKLSKLKGLIESAELEAESLQVTNTSGVPFIENIDVKEANVPIDTAIADANAVSEYEFIKTTTGKVVGIAVFPPASRIPV